MNNRLFQTLRAAALPFLLIAVAACLYGFAGRYHARKPVKQFAAQVIDEDRYRFITREMIGDMLNSASYPALNVKAEEVDLERVEREIKKNSFVSRAEAWLDMQNRLHVKVWQRVPYIRALTPGGKQYYLDTDGERMPLSPTFSALVCLATPSPADTLLKGAAFRTPKFEHLLDSTLFVVGNYFAQDSFAQSICGQLEYDSRMNLAITPRLGNFRISLGDASNLERKFTYLKAFYYEKLPVEGWDKYRELNLRYENQIIAIK